MTTFDELTERIAEWQNRLPWPPGYTGLVVAAITELAAGEPVEVSRVAQRAGVPPAVALDIFHGTPAEFDRDGRLIGFGLTLRPTHHRVELDGRTLYTWCAPDTLELPVLLGKPVRVESPCFATLKPVRIEADPSGVRTVVPEEAVVSIVLADACMSDFRELMCDEQHFFSSAAAAAAWHAERPEAIVVPVRSGFVLARLMVAPWLGIEPAGDAFDRALAELSSCALDGPGRAAQKARYARLAPSITSVRRESAALLVEFDDRVEVDTLEQVIAVERECCPFFRFAFDPQLRRLRVTVEDGAMVPALDAIGDAFDAAEGRAANSPGESA